ncbi:hypothetical protein DXT66_02430 [Nocardia farcinica]|nr:hypothetical protein DXT66_02430 [Nocardia farcinica]
MRAGHLEVADVDPGGPRRGQIDRELTLTFLVVAGAEIRAPQLGEVAGLLDELGVDGFRREPALADDHADPAEVAVAAVAAGGDRQRADAGP